MLRKLRLPVLAVLAMLSLTGLLVACGDDEEQAAEETTTEEAAGSEEVTVTADEYSFELSDDFQGGETSVSLDNVGEEEHELIFVKINEGFTFQEAIEAQGEKGTTEDVAFIEPVAPGETASAEFEPLKPGNYGMVCTLETKDGKIHLQLGQQLEFQLE